MQEVIISVRISTVDVWERANSCTMHVGTLSLSLLVVLVGTALAEYQRTVTYEGQVLVRCTKTDHIYQLLGHDYIDVWRVGANGTVDLRMHTDIFVQISPTFPECSVLEDNLEAFVRDAETRMVKAKPEASWFEEYHDYEDIVTWYRTLSTNYSNIIKYVPSIGKSVEDRDMPAVHITASGAQDVKKIYFQCQIHAREWISGATCMYIANYLAENYGKDEQVTNLLKSLEFIFVPFVNPDGYAYTWSGDRLWRKNRRKGSICDGVDLNRNYPDHWGKGGSSSNECSETYMGPSEESEPETQNTVNYFEKNGPIIGAIDWHSYSQLILRPYGWTRQDCPDEKELSSLGEKMHNAAIAVHKKYYTSEKSIDLYLTTGTASDWFYCDAAAEGNKGYRAAGYTIELRDTGEYGFLLPPDQIIPTGQEMVPTVITFAEYLEANPIPYKGSK